MLVSFIVLGVAIIGLWFALGLLDVYMVLITLIGIIGVYMIAKGNKKILREEWVKLSNYTWAFLISLGAYAQFAVNKIWGQ